MKRLRHLLLAFALVFAFAAGQYASALHALGHAVDELAQQDSKQPPPKCEQHSLFASIADGLGAEAPVAPFVAAIVSAEEVAPAAGVALPSRYSFLSRAPPASLA